MGVASEIEPLYIVANQLKTFTAEGIATENVIALKISETTIDWPEVNMWCPQTRKPSNAIATLE